MFVKLTEHAKDGIIARVFVVFLLVSAGVGFMTDVAPSLSEYAAWLGSLSWFILAAITYLFLHNIFRGDHRIVAPVLLGVITAVVLVRLAGLADALGYSGWFLFLVLIVAFIKVDHPSVVRMEPLTRGRRIIGYLCILIFVLCFSIQPIHIR